MPQGVSLTGREDYEQFFCNTNLQVFVSDIGTLLLLIATPVEWYLLCKPLYLVVS